MLYKKALNISIIFLFIFILVTATFKRNIVWNQEISLWKDTVNKSPYKARAYNGLGYAYLMNNMIEDAIKQYQKAISIDHDNIDAHYNLGVAFKDKGLLDEAISQWKTVIQIRHDHIEAYHNLGTAYIYKEQPHRAIEYYKIAINLKSDPLLHHNLGVAYEKIGFIDNAMMEYISAINLDPYYAEAYYNLANIYFNKKLFWDAIENYLKAINLKPYLLEAHLNLGIAYLQIGDINKAKSQFKALLKIKPDHKQAIELLNNILATAN